MEIKQHTLEQPLGQRKNKSYEILWDKGKDNTTYQKLKGAAKAVLRGKFWKTL